jgi:uncharacterized protein (TIGR01777 family)
MRVVVAGSSGLIGAALVAALRQADHEVFRLVRWPAAAPDERDWDPPAGTIQPGALDGVAAVVNLCGVGVADRRWTAARKQVIRDSRTVPTEVLAGAVAEHRVPIMVNASAVGYYGDTGDTVVDETAPAGAGFLADVCRDWEAATAPAAHAGARVVRLRTGLVLSGSGGLLGRLSPLFGLMLGAKLGEGQQWMPWISLADEVDAIRFALERDDLAGPVNLTAPAPVTNAEFTRALGRALGRPAPWTVPAFALRAALGELAEEALLGGQRAVPEVLRRHGYRFRHPALAAALSALTGR